MKGSASELNSPFPHIVIQSSVSQLPVLGIDQMTAVFKPQMNGVIYSALGATIDMECNLSASQGNFDLILNARSPQMTVEVAAQTAME